MPTRSYAFPAELAGTSIKTVTNKSGRLSTILPRPPRYPQPMSNKVNTGQEGSSVVSHVGDIPGNISSCRRTLRVNQGSMLVSSKLFRAPPAVQTQHCYHASLSVLKRVWNTTYSVRSSKRGLARTECLAYIDSATGCHRVLEPAGGAGFPQNKAGDGLFPRWIAQAARRFAPR